MQRSLDILALGEVNVDLILSGLPRIPDWGTEVLADAMDLRLGGSTANMACAAAALGLKVALVGWVGEDEFGDFLLDDLRRKGVLTDYVRRTSETPTGLTVALSGAEDRAFVTSMGTISFLQAADVPDELLASARHVHVGSFFLQTRLKPDLASLLARAHAAGATVSLDAGYDPSESWNGHIAGALAQTDVFLPNEIEATAITRRDDPCQAAEALAAMGPLAVVKLGAEGACAHDGSRLVRAEGFRVQVADTTACGDAFNAGFLQAWLAGTDLEEALARGNACGALMATVSGNDPSVLTPAAIERLIKQS